jgi:hypothetical protein
VASSPERYKAMASSSVKMSKDLPEVFDKGVNKDSLDRDTMAMGRVPSPSALGETHMNPVSSPVACSFKSCCIDEGFQEHNRMPIDLLPVLGKKFGHPPQEMRSQMGNLHPRQNKEPSVLDNKRDVSISVGGTPSDEMIPASHLPGSSSPAHARQRATLMKSDIFEMFADGLAVPQVMIGRDETFIERLPGGTAHHSDLDRSKLLERGLKWALAVEGNLNRMTAPRTTSGSFLPWRKYHMTCPFQTQKKFTAGHGLGHTVALLPVPETAKFLGDEFPALGLMPLDNGSNENDVTLDYPSAPDDKRRLHGLYIA